MDDSVKKKLIVCGDSWNSVSSYKFFYKGTHWSELLAKELNFELLSFAQPGAGNKAIVLQVIEAIENKPDLIIIGACSSSDRVEIMGDQFYINSERDRVSLKDMLYANENPASKKSVTPENSIRSTPINLIKDNRIKDIYARTHSQDFQSMVDTWCLLYALRKLELSKIPYLMYPILFETIFFKYKDYNDFCNIKNILMSFDHTRMWQAKAPIPNDPGYHTPPQFQPFVKDKILNHIKQNSIL